MQAKRGELIMGGCHDWGIIEPTKQPQNMSREELLAEVGRQEEQQAQLRRERDEAERKARRARRWS